MLRPQNDGQFGFPNPSFQDFTVRRGQRIVEPRTGSSITWNGPYITLDECGRPQFSVTNFAVEILERRECDMPFTRARKVVKLWLPYNQGQPRTGMLQNWDLEYQTYAKLIYGFE